MQICPITYNLCVVRIRFVQHKDELNLGFFQETMSQGCHGVNWASVEMKSHITSFVH